MDQQRASASQRKSVNPKRVMNHGGVVVVSLSAGLLGPTLRAQEGETIVVTFRNMATGPHSIHPHGVAYGKQSEGGCSKAQLGLRKAAAVHSIVCLLGSETKLPNSTNNFVCLLLKY